MPKDIKYSMSVNHHSSIVMTISKMPKWFVEGCVGDTKERVMSGYTTINHYWLEKSFEGAALKLLEKIKKAMNMDNYDNSDIMTDYFDVGHYVDINVGKWNKPAEIV